MKRQKLKFLHFKISRTRCAKNVLQNIQQWSPPSTLKSPYNDDEDKNSHPGGPKQVIVGRHIFTRYDIHSL